MKKKDLIVKHQHDDYCLVLSGGGAKGIYHVGVWKALKELGIEVSAVIGNSIGAIIAAFLAQGEDEVLAEIAEKIGLDFILKVPEELMSNGELQVPKRKIPVLRHFYKDFLERRGLDTTPLRELLLKHLDENKIRETGKDLGVVTFNLTEMRSEEAFVEQMAPGTLIDYLMASSAFPGFERPKIGGKKYIDGGVSDNMPYAMARRRGYKRIIVVDISGMGLNRRPHIEGGITVYIKNSIRMGGALVFNRAFLDSFMELGYLDTMRTFDRLKGYKYFFMWNDELEKSFARYLQSPDGTEALSVFLSGHGHRISDPVSQDIRLFFPRRMRFERNLLLVLCDCAADFVEVDRIRQYTYQELYTAIKKKREAIDKKILREFSESRRSPKLSKAVESILKNSLKKNEFELPPYYYYKLLEFVLREKTARLLKARLSGYFPAVQAADFYLSVMDRFGTGL